MRAVVQRASQAHVSVNDEIVGRLSDPGLVVLLGISVDDGAAEADQLAEKIYHLRILDEEQSCASAGAALLVISQFTLYGDVRRGRRPSWVRSARPEQAEPLYERFSQRLRDLGAVVEQGIFGAMMEVSLINSGPFTVVIDTDDLNGPRRG